MKKLTAVDNTLKKLGSPNMYWKMHMMSIRMIIGWVIYSLIINFCDTKYWLDNTKTSWGLILPYIINYCLHINALIDLLFIFLLRFVYSYNIYLFVL